ncbi:acid-sensing ion channel 1C-like [Physella acuta]|uniref:acid-sensing ion channel 1C-like n=1 Tax=Physella acuta TaxID=109671 RepID=UPI0027DD91A0|nr:acid-sensing ion channel 1C-like [Physella acuta]
MLIQCSFAGRKCFPDNFTHVYSETYGNCYTIQYEKFIMRKNGPPNGLELILYVESAEYIPTIMHETGFRVVVHQQGTVPFPNEDSVSVMPGTSTFIGVKQTCQRICEQSEIRKQCECIPNSEIEINNTIGNPNNLSACKNETGSKPG